MNKFSSLFRRRTILIVTGILVLGGIGYAATRPPEAEVVETKPAQVAIPVRVQKAADRFESVELVTYPGTITAENEAAIVAKTNGTASNITVNVGDQVIAGQELVKIDDVTSNGRIVSSSGFNADQVKQAEIAVQQALASLQLARNNQATVLQSSNRDLEQAQIAANQSATAKQNLTKTTEEGLKTAESNYETAKIATEQARIALENRKKISDQSSSDVKTNADTVIATAGDTSASVISGINAATGVEVSTGGIVSYRDRLGTLDNTSSERAHQSYLAAAEALKTYRSGTFSDQLQRLTAVTDLVKKTKRMTDDVKYMLDKTLASTVLPQATLTTLQTQAAGYQTQMNAIQAQLDQVLQAMTNTDLNNTTTLDALQKAYEIAKQQEETAARNIANLKAGNTTQADQAQYSIQSAQNQLESARTRVNGQISSASSQVELAQIQYQNALLALQNVSDAHRAIAPISGVVIRKSVSNGDTVAPGQTLAIIGTPDQLKISFFIDQESLNMIAPGLGVRITATDGTSASGTVISISPQADMATRRYEVEIRPMLEDGTRFSLGSIVDIAVPLRKVAAQGNILVPISSVDVTPNGTFLTIMRDGKAERLEVEIRRILGEIVEINAPVTPETDIIIEGSRLVSPGSPVTVIE